MKKILSIIALVFMTVSLTSCKNTPEDELVVTLETFNFSYTQEIENIYIFLQEEVIIYTYDEYVSYLAEPLQEDYEYLTADYFNTNSLVLYPVFSDRNPEFILDNYDVNEGKINIELIQKNSFDRTEENYYMEDYYTNEISVNTKDTFEININLLIDDSYYSVNTFIGENASECFGENEYLEITNIDDYTAFVACNNFYKYDSGYINNLYTESTFEDHILVISYAPGGGYDYVQPLDVRYQNGAYDQYVTIVFYQVGYHATIFYPDIVSMTLIDTSNFNEKSIIYRISYVYP
jgi:hypothetical protein